MVSMANYRYTMLASPDPKSVNDRPNSIRAQLRKKHVQHGILGAAVVALLIAFGVYFSVKGSQTRRVKIGADGQELPMVQFEFAPESRTANALRLSRQAAVKDAFLHAWEGYKTHAWLNDEVKPVSGDPKDNYNGWAATLVDGLDTLWIMGFEKDFEEAVEAVKTINFQHPKQDMVNFFESTIRYLGGLLGAYDVSHGKYPVLLDQAKSLGEFLSRAFHTSNGLPVPLFNWTSDSLSGSEEVGMAAVSTMTLEFTRLSQLSGDKKYFDMISHVMDVFEKGQNETKIPGLWPSKVDTLALGFPSSKFTFGGGADSGYEYMIKEHVLLSTSASRYLKMHNLAYNTAKKRLFFRPKVAGSWNLIFPGNLDLSVDENAIIPEIAHLTCFIGGVAALSAKINNSPEQLADAEKLTNTCVWAYQTTACGIMPERFNTEICQGDGPCSASWEDVPGQNLGFARIDDYSYKLRPEAIESVFVMYRLTGDTKWQEIGWQMFEVIQKHTRTDIAYAELSNVTVSDPPKMDYMESYFLAETLKYFYLLFSDPSLISLDDYVLNTEAHPFRLQVSYKA